VSDDDFLSGTSGQVWGVRATSRAAIADFACDAAALVTLEQPRLRRAARVSPRRRVLVLAVQREDAPNILVAARDELLSSHHEVRFESSPVAGRGKFENLDVLLERVPVEGFDWLLVLDDDVALPRVRSRSYVRPRSSRSGHSARCAARHSRRCCRFRRCSSAGGLTRTGRRLRGLAVGARA